MNKLLLAAALILTGLTVLAQGSGAYLTIMPGYILNTPSQTLYTTSWTLEEREMKKGFVGSIEGGFAVDKNLGLHFAYIGATQHFTDRGYYNGSFWYASNGSVPLNIIELGPEFSWWPSESSQLFAQINLGHTIASRAASYESGYTDNRIRDDDWTYGLAIGYRGYIIKAVGLCVQVTYHHVNAWSTPSIWAAQLGIAFRF